MAVTGTFIGDFSSFQAAVEQSNIKIREFEGNSAKVSSTLDKVANSFSGRKIIQEATLMAAAIEKGGGEARLTASELERAGRVAAEAADKMRALGIAVPKNISDLAGHSKEASSFLGELGDHALSTAAGMFTAEAAMEAVNKVVETGVDFIKESVNAYAAEELALKRVSAALKVQGQLTPEVTEHYKELGEEVQRNSVFSHTAAQESEALLIQVGDVGPKQMKKALAAVTDLASGLGIDLHSATLLIGKAFEGNTATLGRYGIVLDQARVKAEGITYVLDALEDKFGGQAQAEVETYSGKVKQLGNDWENFQEAVGKSIVQDPLLVGALQLAREHVQDLSKEAQDSKPTFIQYWATLAGADTSVPAITALEHVLGLFQEVDAQVAHMKPPPPPQFADEGDKGIDKRMADAKKLAEQMAKGWVDEEKNADKYWNEEQKRNSDRIKLFMDEQAVFGKEIAESAKLQVEQGGTAREQQIANIRVVEQQEIESLTRRGTATAANLKLLHENADKAIKGLGIDWKMLAEQSLDTARQQRDDALETYNYMLSHADQYTREALDKQLAKYRQLAEAATAHGRAAVDAQDAAAEATKRHNDELDKQKKKEEDAAAANDKLRRDRVSTTQITAANFDQYTPPQGISKSAVLDLLKQGFSMENALAILQATQRGANVDLSKWPEDSRGPRVPGFKSGVSSFSGGPAIVGEDGPEMLNLPAGSSVTSNRALWDQLNEQQGRMFVEGGGFASEAILRDPAYQKIIESMKALNPAHTAGYWDEDSARDAMLKWSAADVVNGGGASAGGASGGGARARQFSPLNFGRGDERRPGASVNVFVSGVFDPNSRSSLEKVVTKELAFKVFGGRRSG